MAGTRLYQQNCLLAQALNVIGDRWALLIVRELLGGPQRFSDLRAGLPGLSPNVLTERLAELQASGVVERKVLPAPASTPAYVLTRRGRGLRRTLEALVRWGQEERLDRGAGTASLASVRLLLEASFDAGRASMEPLLLRLTLGEDHLGVEVRDGCLNLWAPAPDAPPHGVTSLYGPPALFADLILARRTLDDALSAGEIRLEGERADVDRFLRFFPDRGSSRPGV